MKWKRIAVGKLSQEAVVNAALVFFFFNGH
jgi:hypothetical protein